MLHTDIPTRREIETLAEWTGPWSVSIYLPTEAATANPEANRIAFGNQVREAVGLVTDADSRAAIAEQLDDLAEDADFWRFQSHTLVVHVSPQRMWTFRIPNRLGAAVTVSNRFLLKPLLRAVTFPQAAFVLALAEGSARLVEVTPDRPAEDVRVPEMPAGAVDFAGESVDDRAPKRRSTDSERKKVLARQYARAVDRALRDILSGRDTPLILAAAEPIDAIYRSVATYAELLDDGIPGNPEHLSDQDLADKARHILDGHYAAQLADLRQLFDKRRSEARATADLADIARASTFGMVQTLLVDIDTAVPGTVAPDTGAIEFGPASETEIPGILDEIARRALLSGARVLAVRKADIPDEASAAAILRYSM
ncbi:MULTISPECIES: baeRF11 domain-containing protein [Nocardia]|uniref:Uncharacterized protein n=1 Tax=Nocardia nova TaxID=37330 RepID=A0A2T2ZAT6_9NOCA|nr:MULTISPECIES: hypothetical protein [Nocardia]PSR64871.1 hypothetical protein C8259_07770 [Nocardia nova]